MTDNNPESFDDVRPIADFQQLESQLHCEDEVSKDEEDEIPSEKYQLWTNWNFFIVPGRIIEMQSKKPNEDGSKDSQHSDDPPDYDRYVPRTKTGRQIGVMNYVLHEEGNISIEETLYIDVVLHRVKSFSPQMAGVDRYDDMGIRRLRNDFRRLVEEFFALPPKKRKDALAGFEEIGAFSPEIAQSVNRLNNYVDIPKTKNVAVNPSAPDKIVRCWPDGLTGRDLELFKLLSGIETMSPRSQSLSVLNFILPEEPETQNQDASDLSDGSAKELPAPIRLEPGDKERVTSLLKRFPGLMNRYPYLLKMIEDEIPAEKFNASSDDREYIYSDFLPFSLTFPTVLENSSKESTNQNSFSNSFVKWGVIIAVICSLIKMAAILFNAWVK